MILKEKNTFQKQKLVFYLNSSNNTATAIITILLGGKKGDKYLLLLNKNTWPRALCKLQDE